MELPFATAEVTEGRARLRVPDVPRRKGPNPKGPYPFYNPTMAVSRDLSTIVLSGWPSRLTSVCDGLAASGAWGIRMAVEADIGPVTFNDRSPSACALVRENADRNGVDAEVVSGDLRSLLGERSFQYVDIDPFGPPTPFLGHALHALPPGSGLGVTATDTAPLFGTYPKTCERRYGAQPLRCTQGHEIGLRILLGYVERVAQAHGKAVRPLVAFHAEHFLRLHLEVTDGSRDRDSHLGYVLRDPSGMFVPAGESEPHAVGPLWITSLSDSGFLLGLSPSPWTGPQSGRLLSLLQGEADFPAFFVTTDEMAHRLRTSPPRVERFLEGLQDLGHRAVRTHFDPHGVKTDAPADEIAKAFHAAKSSGPTGD